MVGGALFAIIIAHVCKSDRFGGLGCGGRCAKCSAFKKEITAREIKHADCGSIPGVLELVP